MKKGSNAQKEPSALQTDLFADAPSASAPQAEAAPAPAPPPPATSQYPWRQPSAPTHPSETKPARVVLTVGELTQQMKGVLQQGFTKVCVRGEISGYRGPHPRGHLYFSLKDSDACLDARIWASVAQRLKFRLKDGMEVIAEGSIDLYEPQGRYALIVSRLEPAGEGALALAFAQLKEKLQAEGLFGPNRIRPPRPLPYLPRRIGVVTSRTGAALQDFLRVLHQRHPRLSVLLCDARVQGDGAAWEITLGIRRLVRHDVDVIVVTRGGGSIEDLWAFNEEAVARAIFQSPIPVVSAVGHEVDFTIADFVADHRAPTPSAAAEKLAPVLRDLELALLTFEGRLRKAAERSVLGNRQKLRAYAARLLDPRRVLAQKQLHLAEETQALGRALRRKLRNLKEAQKQLSDRLARLRPEARVAQRREQLSRLKARLFAWPGERLRQHRAEFSRHRIAFERSAPLGSVRKLRAEFGGKLAKLHALSPLNVMARGYAVVFEKSGGHVVRRAAELEVGSEIAVRLLPPGEDTLEGCEEVDARVTGIKTR